jgi:hypothetical protein
MGFAVSFRGPARVAGPQEPPSDLDYESVAVDACSILAKMDCSFIGSGFGETAWPLDVGYDLSTFVEQLPESLIRIEIIGSAEIDLYGQGMERTLHFEVRGTRWKSDALPARLGGLCLMSKRSAVPG